MTGTLREVALGLALLGGVCGPGAAHAAPGADLAVAARQLAVPSAQRAAVEALARLGDPAAERVLRALKDGALYRWQNGVAILGDDGALVDLGGQPLRDGTGQPVSPHSAEDAVALDEQVFGAVQGALERFKVLSPDPAARRSAAFRLGSTGELAAIPVLVQAIEREQDRFTRRVVEEALAKLRLSSADPTARADAARALGGFRSEAALAQLRVLAERDPDHGAREAAREAVRRVDSFVFLRSVFGYLFNGVSLGAVLLMMSLGLAVTFGLMGIINMAHGEMLMIGSYTAYVVQELFARHLAAHADAYFLLALPLAFVVAAMVGLGLELGIIRFLYGRPLETLIVTWGIGMIFQQSARLYFGDQTSVNPPAWLRGGVEVVTGLIFPWSRLFIVVLSLAVLAVLGWLLHRSYPGLLVQAAMQNRGMASCLGVSTRRIDALTFALGTGLAGVAGCALALIGTVDPEVGKTYIVDSFMVVVLGGVGKLLGTVVASSAIGLSNKLLEPLIGGTAAAVYAKVAVLAIVIWFLQLRPTGLFAPKGRAAAEASGAS